MEAEINHFVEKKAMLRKFYKKFMRNGRRLIIQKYGKQKGERLLKELWITFESLIPEMPIIRTDDPALERHVILQTIYLAIYKTLKKRDEKTEDIWQLCADMIDKMFQSIPKYLKWLVGKNLFSNKEKMRIMSSAITSHVINYSEDFQFDYIVGDGNHFEYGYNMTQCPACAFYKRQNAEEFTPYVCRTGELFSKHYGYKLIRTQTLANGYKYCDFRFKQN
ncbi:MAG: hypothetical protein C0597_06950 [Marinilabiliales bacterium]|nr:MAG: hypothetical protein C0597_06950 [Marinilabiliales bacterium]